MRTHSQLGSGGPLMPFVTFVNQTKQHPHTHGCKFLFPGALLEGANV
jgi:hypothetical protein